MLWLILCALFAVAFCAILALVLALRVAIRGQDDGENAPFDPFPKANRFAPVGFVLWLTRWRNGRAPQLTYRRDEKGRFRKHRR